MKQEKNILMATKKTTNNINDIIKQIQEKYGDESISTGDNSMHQDIDIIPTGSLGLDYILGIGGIPRGRITEIYGPESSGKTLLALNIIKQAQEQGLTSAFVDAEHALSFDFAKKIGVDLKKLLISQPNCGEEALGIAEDLLKTKEVGLIVIDSVSALTPTAEIEGKMGAQHIGLQARLMSQALRKMTALAASSNTAVIFINQIRMSIGVTWGNPEVTCGGKALKFYTSVRIEVRKAAKLKKKEDIIGNRVKVKIAKNKLAAPYKTTEYDILYNEGISVVGDILLLGQKYNLIKKEGLSYYYNNDKIAVGLDKTKEEIKNNPVLLEELTTKIKEKMTLQDEEANAIEDSTDLQDE